MILPLVCPPPLSGLPAIPPINGIRPKKKLPNKKAGQWPAIVIDSLLVVPCIVRQPDEGKQEQVMARLSPIAALEQEPVRHPVLALGFLHVAGGNQAFGAAAPVGRPPRRPEKAVFEIAA